jgi:hypothetical protein
VVASYKITIPISSKAHAIPHLILSTSLGAISKHTLGGINIQSTSIKWIHYIRVYILSVVLCFTYLIWVMCSHTCTHTTQLVFTSHTSENPPSAVVRRHWALCLCQGENGDVKKSMFVLLVVNCQEKILLQKERRHIVKFEKFKDATSQIWQLWNPRSTVEHQSDVQGCWGRTAPSVTSRWPEADYFSPLGLSHLIWIMEKKPTHVKLLSHTNWYMQST